MPLDMLPRVVEPETLDALPENDPSAVRSRRDLRRVNRVMGTRSIFVRALRGLPLQRTAGQPLRILELGSGDGHLLLGIAGGVGAAWRPAELTLLDRQRLVADDTLAAYARLGWSARGHVADVLDWAAQSESTAGPSDAGGRYDLIVANLFLHHFQGAELAGLMGAVASRCTAFFACEPRRSRLALAGSHLIGAIGANAVTRDDAVTSVHSGFLGAELTALWPAADAGWQVDESPAGLFSHCFRAVRGGAVARDRR